MPSSSAHSYSLTTSKSSIHLLLGLVLGTVVLLACLLLSILLGAADIDADTVWNARFQFDGSTDHLIIRTVRLPRAILAVVVGSALAVAGWGTIWPRGSAAVWSGPAVCYYSAPWPWSDHPSPPQALSALWD